MAKLVYLTNASLDGYIEDEHGACDLYEPDDDVFAATTTALLRSFGTFLYGRRLYEAMSVGETNPALAIDAAGLPRIGVDGRWHTWATLALRAGVPVKVVRTRLGHADPVVTMQVYAHALAGDDSTVAETTATAIFGP